MHLRRRGFIVGAFSVLPALMGFATSAWAKLPEAGLPREGEVKPAGSRFAIEGWRSPAPAVADAGNDDQVLIRLSSSWRAAWH